MGDWTFSNNYVSPAQAEVMRRELQLKKLLEALNRRIQRHNSLKKSLTMIKIRGSAAQRLKKLGWKPTIDIENLADHIMRDLLSVYKK